ncbi:MAG TPA: hypothetical protein DD377_04595 [Firmicutes bacterium]|nr:hypothetical protein [Bacillota bacterium]HBM70624.1 hypothetical protein [Bacillota bacterium]
MIAFLSNKIKKWKKNTQLITGMLGLFLAGCVCFCSGAPNENTTIESAAATTSKFALKNSNTKYISIQISPKNADAKKTMPNTYNEYFYWKYIFRHSDFGFLSTVNGGKTHRCYFGEIDVNKNISFISCNNNFNPEYENFYKHEVYDTKLMFKGKNIISQGAINFFAISQTRASQILLKRGEHADNNGDFSIDQYEQLIGTNTQLYIDGNSYLFTISNIFFESGQFHEDMSQNFGEYVLSYIRFPDFLESESTYIFNTYDYQNIHKIKRIRTLFDKENFSFNLSSFNLKNSNYHLSDVFDYNYIFCGNSSKIGNDFLSIFLLLLSFFAFAFSIYVILISDLFNNAKYAITIMFFFSLPYVILSIVYFAIKTPFFFSFFSLVSYLIMSVVLIAVFAFALYKERGDMIRKHL